MTYSGHVKGGQILLDQPASLPEGTRVKVEVEQPSARKPFRDSRADGFQPVQLPGDSLADQIIRDRR